jgi:hypothetical protein
MKVALVWFLLYALFMVLNPLGAEADEYMDEYCDIINELLVEAKFEEMATDRMADAMYKAEDSGVAKAAWIFAKHHHLLSQARVQVLKQGLKANCIGGSDEMQGV